MKSLSICFAIVTLTAAAGSANAASPLHIDDLAARLQRQTARLTYEVEHQFRYTRDYKHLLHDAEDMEDLARHIHDVAHDFGSRRHIAADLRKMDRLFHHIEELIDGMEYRARLRARDCRYRRSCRFRGVRLAQIRQLQRIMSRISNTLHHLQDDVRPVSFCHPSRNIRPAVIAPRRPFVSLQF